MLIEGCRGDGGIAEAGDGPGTTEAACDCETASFVGLLLLTSTPGMAALRIGSPMSFSLVDLWPEEMGSRRVADEGT